MENTENLQMGVILTLFIWWIFSKIHKKGNLNVECTMHMLIYALINKRLLTILGH